MFKRMFTLVEMRFGVPGSLHFLFHFVLFDSCLFVIFPILTRVGATVEQIVACVFVDIPDIMYQCPNFPSVW